MSFGSVCCHRNPKFTFRTRRQFKKKEDKPLEKGGLNSPLGQEGQEERQELARQGTEVDCNSGPDVLVAASDDCGFFR